MNKYQIRKKILLIKKKRFDKNLKIDLDKFVSFFKIYRFNNKNVGGYYTSNYEIDDLNILDFLEKKKF